MGKSEFTPKDAPRSRRDFTADDVRKRLDYERYQPDAPLSSGTTVTLHSQKPRETGASHI